VHYMHSKGRKRIVLLVTESQSSSILKRCRGYLAAIKELGLPYGEEMIYRVGVASTEEVTPELLGRFVDNFVLSNKPDAIISTNDRMAAMVINKLKSSGLRVPEDVAVSGYDNAGFADVYYPALTTVDQNNKEVAKAALDMMVSLIEGSETPQDPRHIRIKPQLIVRDSA